MGEDEDINIGRDKARGNSSPTEVNGMFPMRCFENKEKHEFDMET